MSVPYDIQAIEKKWRNYWQQHPYHTKKTGDGKKFYCLDMFPYPSGSGLHVGHWRGYILSDVYARMKWLEGYNVLHPMGWDAFGLPAENDAIKKGIHPAIGTARNIATFKEQLETTAALYDWSKELTTTDPAYYHWTQWIFIKMYKAGLAYQATVPINWCPSCLTGLANEEVVNGGCERCGSMVEQKNIRQWMLKITAYAEKLLNDLDTLAWPEKVKLMQKNWIGKSEGLIFSAPVKDSNIIIETFSAHFESFEADTFVVIAPDHSLLPRLLEGNNLENEVLSVCEKILSQRAGGIKDDGNIEGVFTGRYIVDPVSGNELPIWVASFALAHYGTGIVKCSSHDERDFAFAKKYTIPLKAVLFPPNDPARSKRIADFEECYTDMKEGILSAPATFSGKRAGGVRAEIIRYCQEKGYARPHITYKLRDWVFSRQRYWGEPIPMIHCNQCGVVPVPEDQLPVILPDVESYQPTGTGESPLAGIASWVTTSCPRCHGSAQRETNTMPQWAGSSWYFLRYPNPQLATAAFDEKDMKYWMPVDLYVGGIEHAILHLLYARFYTKVLHDLGYIPFNEPFSHLFNQGMVCKYSEKTGLVEKMSKSKGNVVNPDEIVSAYGSDALRLYILFMGPPELDCEWQDNGLEGMKRFLQRLWTYFTTPGRIIPLHETESLYATKRAHRLLKAIAERLQVFKPNTALSACMEWLNDATAHNMQLSRETAEKIIVTLSVFAPHMTSELLSMLLDKRLEDCSWPTFDEALASVDETTIAIQISGKTRATITVPTAFSQQQIEQLARQEVAKWLENKEVIKTIFVPSRLINFVAQ